MMKRPWISAVLLTIYLCFGLWFQRSGGSRIYAMDLIGSSLVSALSVAAGWFASTLLTRDIHRRGLIALVAGLWGLIFNTFQLFAESTLGSWFQSAPFAAGVWTALCGFVCWQISRGSAPLVFATKALGVATVILLATPLVRLAPRLVGAEAADSGTPAEVVAARTNANAKVVDRRDGRRPDVFLIVLDKFSSGAWLSHTYGVDHKPFEDSLRTLGFAVPDRRAGELHAHPDCARQLSELALHRNS